MKIEIGTKVVLPHGNNEHLTVVAYYKPSQTLSGESLYRCEFPDGTRLNYTRNDIQLATHPEVRLSSTLHYKFMVTGARPDGFWALVASKNGTVQHTFNNRSDLLSHYTRFLSA